MTTCTPEQVSAINGSTATDEEIQPFIDAAACILERVETCTTGKEISESCLEQACAFLAAHLMAGTAQHGDTAAVKRETFENYTVERVVGGFSGNGIMGTTYGQAANGITGGCLQEADKAPAGIMFGGGA